VGWQMHYLVDGRILLDRAPFSQRQVNHKQASDSQHGSDPSDEGTRPRSSSAGAAATDPGVAIVSGQTLEPLSGNSAWSDPILWPSCGLLGTWCGRNLIEEASRSHPARN